MAEERQVGATNDASRSDISRDASSLGLHDGHESIESDASATGCTYSGILATWSLANQPGSQTSTAATSSAPSVTAADLRRGAALTAASGSGSINAASWTTGTQVDATKYYTLSISALGGCTIQVTSLAIDVLSSTTGPANAVVGTSADAFAQTTPVSTAAPSTPTVSASSTGSLEIRIYGYKAGGTSGTMRVQNTLSVSGILQ